MNRLSVKARKPASQGKAGYFFDPARMRKREETMSSQGDSSSVRNRVKRKQKPLGAHVTVFRQLGVRVLLIWLCALLGPGKVVLAEAERLASDTFSIPRPAEMGCGVQALFAAAKILGLPVSMEEIIRAVEAEDETTSFLMLKTGSEKVGFQCQGVSLSQEDLAAHLADSDHVAIVPYGDDHFVLAVEASPSRKEFLIYDFPSGYRVSVSDFGRKFGGKALLLGRAAGGKFSNLSEVTRETPSYFTTRVIVTLTVSACCFAVVFAWIKKWRKTR